VEFDLKKLVMRADFIPSSVKTSFALLCLLLITLFQANAQHELDIIRGNWLHYRDASSALYQHLSGQAYELLEQRVQTISKIQSLDEWKKRQEWIRKTMLEVVGPFPEKTPLNSRIIRIVDKGDYKVEHIVFESQPGFYVTSSLFVPRSIKGKTKAPAILYCSGHSNEGYRSEVYQHVILNLVKKGFLVLAFDPVGQGERLEYFDSLTNKSTVGGPTIEHSYPGAQAFISGSSQAKYMIWDGIRALDYLLTRKEVDVSRIGITGRSGGGTQTAYIGAIDDRIAASAPECYITNFTRLLQSIGPQDAEQNFFQGIARGLDQADFISIRAPKPTLMITTTRDIFSIQGARETAKEVSAVYKVYGMENNFSMVEDDAPHESTRKNREAMYAFFQKHLKNPGSPADEEVAILTDDEIRVTKTGQVSTSLRGETVFSLNRKESMKLVNNLNVSRNNLTNHYNNVLKAAKELSGYREPTVDEAPVFTGRIKREGYSIEKYFMKGEENYVIPYLLMIPDKSNNKAIVYLHPSGKAVEATPGGEMEWFVTNGFAVLAPDLIGVGEMGLGDYQGDAFINGKSHNIWYSSLLIGRSLVGVQAGDLVRLVRMLSKKEGVGAIYGVARGEMSPVLTHAAAFEPAIERVALIESYASYRTLVMNRFYNSGFIYGTVAGSLKEYDLPDLLSTLAPRKILLAGITDSEGKPADLSSVNDDIDVVKRAYQIKNVPGQLSIMDGESLKDPEKLFLEWIK
jgi:hypothetical protein